MTMDSRTPERLQGGAAENLAKTAAEPQNSAGQDPSLHNLSSEKTHNISVTISANESYRCVCCAAEVRPLPCHCGRLACPVCSFHSDDLAERARDAAQLIELVTDPAFYLAVQQAKNALQRKSRVLTVEEIKTELRRTGVPFGGPL